MSRVDKLIWVLLFLVILILGFVLGATWALYQFDFPTVLPPVPTPMEVL